MVAPSAYAHPPRSASMSSCYPEPFALSRRLAHRRRAGRFDVQSMQSFTPAIRIDRYPLICRAAAAATVAFEIGFFPALFFRRPATAPCHESQAERILGFYRALHAERFGAPCAQ